MWVCVQFLLLLVDFTSPFRSSVVLFSPSRPCSLFQPFSNLWSYDLARLAHIAFPSPFPTFQVLIVAFPHCNENPIDVFTRKGTARPQSQFWHSCFCERFIRTLPESVHIFSCSRIVRPIMGICKSLTDTIEWNTHTYFQNRICHFVFRCKYVSFWFSCS